jgi:hypothetical protein
LLVVSSEITWFLDVFGHKIFFFCGKSSHFYHPHPLNPLFTAWFFLGGRDFLSISEDQVASLTPQVGTFKAGEGKWGSCVRIARETQMGEFRVIFLMGIFDKYHGKNII